MAPTIVPAFNNFKAEGEIIGRLVTGYGELEFFLSCCLGSALKNDDSAMRALFRVRSESHRINIADALMRPFYTAVGLADTYNEMLGAIRHCKTIRNQYAHSHWRGDNGWLMFGAMDQAADTAIGEVLVPYAPIDIVVLRLQEEYFIYTAEILRHLWPEYERLTGQSTTQGKPAPKTIPRPPLNNLPKK